MRVIIEKFIKAHVIKTSINICDICKKEEADTQFDIEESSDKYEGSTYVAFHFCNYCAKKVVVRHLLKLGGVFLHDQNGDEIDIDRWGYDK